MTIAGKLVTLFPILFFFLDIFTFLRVIENPGFESILLFLFSVYLVPLIIFRFHNYFFPLRDTITEIAVRSYSAWWTSHQIQLKYIAIPLIEAPLHFFPGLFSFWLRLWGSQIGKGVYWTPRVEIIDRSLLNFGNGVIAGHFAAFCSHAISPVEGKLCLIVQRIQVGDGAFIGAECRLGPGSYVEKGVLVKARTCLYWKGVFKPPLSN